MEGAVTMILNWSSDAIEIQAAKYRRLKGETKRDTHGRGRADDE